MFSVRTIISVIFYLCLLVSFNSDGNTTPTSAAPQLKAAYILNIAKFTRFPALINSANNSTLGLCVYGEGDVSNELKNLQGKQIEKSVIQLIYPSDDNEFNQCQILYISPVERKRYRYLLNLITTKHILTISDDSSFIDSGGLINLTEQNRRLRIEINMGELAISELQLSSKLLKISIQVN